MCGGDDGIRTHGLSIANAALSQLSYIPTSGKCRSIVSQATESDCYVRYRKYRYTEEMATDNIMSGNAIAIKRMKVNL